MEPVEAGPCSSSRVTDRRLSLVDELLLTESSYVRSLADLVELQQTLAPRGIPSSDITQALFSNIGQIYDLHRRFLADLEGLSLRSPLAWKDKIQRLATLLARYEDSFQVYHPYLGSISRFDWGKWVAEFSDLVEASGPQLLNGFGLEGSLLRPASRLAKYPMLFKEFLRLTPDLDEQQVLVPGIQAMERIENSSWDATEVALCQEAWTRLPERVDDWKGHRLQWLGALLLHGIFHIGLDRHSELKQYEVYLFETHLFCFRPQRQSGTRRQSFYSREDIIKSNLVLKGRVLIGDIVRVFPVPQGERLAGMLGRDHQVCIHWSGPETDEKFNICFPNERIAQKWINRLEEQRRIAPTSSNRVRDLERKRRHELIASDEVRIDLSIER